MSAAIFDVNAASAGTGGYPYAHAADCSATYGAVSWCINGNDTSPHGYAYRNSTDYVAFKIQQVFGVILPKNLGNARAWGPELKADGYAYDAKPGVGDIAAWNGPGAGHVAYVYAVNNGIASLDEYNATNTGRFSSTRTTARKSAGSPSEYIHIRLPISSGSTPTPAPLIGYLSTTGTYYVKEGRLAAQWVEEATGVASIALASDGTNGPLIGYLSTTGTYYVKEGHLSAPWVQEATGVASIALVFATAASISASSPTRP